MHTALNDKILQITTALRIHHVEVVQSLWSGYGEILRVFLDSSQLASVIVKHIKLPQAPRHPRGWNTALSHQRKIQSYRVERQWYQHYARLCPTQSPVPVCLHTEQIGDELLLIMSDLHNQGYTELRSFEKTSLNLQDIHSCLDWLAHFHARFMQHSSDGLWPIGSYWHLQTRPDEWQALTDAPLKEAAHAIDTALNNCPWQTIIHGDAKLANFCFHHTEKRVAAVDFQYVGAGCGMKDVAYFIGSCVNDEDCFQLEGSLLDRYFSTLSEALTVHQPHLDANAIEQCWRGYFDLAWADFHRFLMGWSPAHWKNGRYSESVSQRALAALHRD